MKIISVINYKGGVGKTTITANLAAELTNRGKRVLAIDLDPQTNLTFSFIRVEDWQKHYEKEKTIKFWFDSIIETHKAPSFENLFVNKGGIDIICSHLGLIDVDIELASLFSAGTPQQYQKNFVKTYSYIKNELVKFHEKYDVVLFDCPPNFSIVTRNALIASDFYLVPAKMDYLSTLGINQLRSHIRKLVDDYNSLSENKISPELLGVVATMISVRNGQPIMAHQTYINELSRRGIAIFDSMIRENKTLYASAPSYGVPVVNHSYASGTYADVVNELEDLTTEFIAKIGV